MKLSAIISVKFMKKAGNTSKYSGEERVHDSSQIIKKVFEGAKKAPVINAEAIKSAKEAVANEAKSEFNVVLSQVFGFELTPGKSVNLSQKAVEHAQKEEEAEKVKVTSEHLSYFSEFKRNIEGKNEDETSFVIRKQLESILAELRNLKSSSDELENVFKDVVIDSPPEKPGIYHLTFFEGFLKLVMKMKDKVQDGVVYAKLFRSRKQEKSYHSMAKKGGTSYTLHHDRAVATQTG